MVDDVLGTIEFDEAEVEGGVVTVGDVKAGDDGPSVAWEVTTEEGIARLDFDIIEKSSGDVVAEDTQKTGAFADPDTSGRVTIPDGRGEYIFRARAEGDGYDETLGEVEFSINEGLRAEDLIIEVEELTEGPYIKRADKFGVDPLRFRTRVINENPEGSGTLTVEVARPVGPDYSSDKGYDTGTKTVEVAPGESESFEDEFPGNNVAPGELTLAVEIVSVEATGVGLGWEASASFKAEWVREIHPDDITVEWGLNQTMLVEDPTFNYGPGTEVRNLTKVEVEREVEEDVRGERKLRVVNTIENLDRNESDTAADKTINPNDVGVGIDDYWQWPESWTMPFRLREVVEIYVPDSLYFGENEVVVREERETDVPYNSGGGSGGGDDDDDDDDGDDEDDDEPPEVEYECLRDDTEVKVGEEVPVRVRLTEVNGDQDADAEVTIEAADASESESVTVPAGGEAEVEIVFEFDEPGDYTPEYSVDV